MLPAPDAERRAVAAEVLRCVRGRVPVHVCTTAISTQETAALSKHAEERGAAKVIVNPLRYLPLAEAQIEKHYETVARGLRIPIHVYNNSPATGTDMSVGLLRRIVDATGARSIKEAGSRIEKFQELRAEFGADMALHAGFHYMALGGFALGASAWDAGLVPAIAPLCQRLYRAALVDRDQEAAQRLIQAATPLFDFFRVKGALPSLKALAAMEGLDLGGIRAPIETLKHPDIADLHARLERAKLGASEHGT